VRRADKSAVENEGEITKAEGTGKMQNNFSTREAAEKVSTADPSAAEQAAEKLEQHSCCRRLKPARDQEQRNLDAGLKASST
jgi:hypothetical protein